MAGETKVDKTHDVIVIGGGMAGLSAGFSAAMNGADALVLERKKMVGVPVRCGEFFPARDEADGILPNAPSFTRFYDLLREEAISNRTKSIRVYSPRSRRYEFPFSGLVLRREIFEGAIAEEAERIGTTVQTGVNVEAVERRGEKTEILTSGANGNVVLKAKLVIGADGFPSKTVPRVDLRLYIRDENLALCAQRTAYNAKVDDDVVEMFLGMEYAPGGYAWVIPKGNGEANVGVGARLSHLKRGKTVVDYLNHFVERHPSVSERLQKAMFGPLIAKTLPVGGLAPYVYGDGLLLAGDAAGMVIATNGSGIPTALASGFIAGKIAARHLRGDCPLSSYESALRKEIVRPVKRGYLYRRVGDVFMGSDRTFETLLRIIGTGNVAKVIKCVPIKPFFR